MFDLQKPERKTRGKLTLRAPVPKTSLSATSSPADSKSTPSTPGTESAQTPNIESAKCETTDTKTTCETSDTGTIKCETSDAGNTTTSPSSDKENNPARTQVSTKKVDQPETEGKPNYCQL